MIFDRSTDSSSYLISPKIINLIKENPSWSQIGADELSVFIKLGKKEVSTPCFPKGSVDDVMVSSAKAAGRVFLTSIQSKSVLSGDFNLDSAGDHRFHCNMMDVPRAKFLEEMIIDHKTPTQKKTHCSFDHNRTLFLKNI